MVNRVFEQIIKSSKVNKDLGGWQRSREGEHGTVLPCGNTAAIPAVPYGNLMAREVFWHGKGSKFRTLEAFDRCFLTVGGFEMLFFFYCWFYVYIVVLCQQQQSTTIKQSTTTINSICQKKTVLCPKKIPSKKKHGAKKK